MKSKRPLGWWDTGRPARTYTRRCDNQRTKIIGLLTELQAHPDYRQISEFTHRVLNLAADRSALGEDDVAKDLQKRLRRALEQIVDGNLSFSEVLSLASASKPTNTTAGTDAPASLKDQ